MQHAKQKEDPNPTHDPNPATLRAAVPAAAGAAAREFRRHPTEQHPLRRRLRMARACTHAHVHTCMCMHTCAPTYCIVPWLYSPGTTTSPSSATPSYHSCGGASTSFTPSPNPSPSPNPNPNLRPNPNPNPNLSPNPNPHQATAASTAAVGAVHAKLCSYNLAGALARGCNPM